MVSRPWAGEGLVVGRVLAERLELLEPRVHGAGSGVERSAVRARGLGEVPELLAPGDLVPGSDAGKRCVHDDEALDPAGVLHGEREADHVADVVGDEVHLVELQRVEYARNVMALCLLVVAAGRTRRTRKLTGNGCTCAEAVATVSGVAQVAGGRERALRATHKGQGYFRATIHLTMA